MVEEPATLSQQSTLSIDTECVWALWSVSLRLEMLCSSLEVNKGHGVALQPPETAMLEKMKYRGGEVTDRFLVNFMTHQVSRIEVCSFPLPRYLLLIKISDVHLHPRYPPSSNRSLRSVRPRPASSTHGRRPQCLGSTTARIEEIQGQIRGARA